MFAGITGTLIALVWFAQRAHFELDAVRATAEVLDVERGLTRDRKAVYALTLRWTDQTGTIHETVPNMRASFYDVPVGTELDIKYDPDDPGDVRVETKEGPWYFPCMILLGSVVNFLLGRLMRGPVGS